LFRRLVDVVFFAHIKRDRRGLAAGLGDFRHHGVQRIRPAARYHHGPAIGSERFRPGLANAAAAAGYPGHAFPAI
jgi:hypothetical protein